MLEWYFLNKLLFNLKHEFIVIYSTSNDQGTSRMALTHCITAVIIMWIKCYEILQECM